MTTTSATENGAANGTAGADEKDKKAVATKSDKRMTDEEIFDGAGAKGTVGTFMDPDKLVLVEDEASGLYDERAKEKLPETFVQSIRDHGILENVLVHRNLETGRIEVVAGRRRVLAARQLKAEGHPVRVPVVAKRGEMTDLIVLMLVENEHRKDDDPVNRARKIQAALNAGVAPDDLAKRIGVSLSTVKNAVVLLDAPKDIQRAAESKKIGAAEGYKLAKIARAEGPEAAKEKLQEILGVETASASATKREKKKARKQALAPKSGHVVRAKGEIEAMLKRMKDEEVYKAREQEVVVGVLKWVLGNDRGISGACTRVGG